MGHLHGTGATHVVPFIYIRRGTHDVDLPEHIKFYVMGCTMLKFRGDLIITNAATARYKTIEEIFNDV